MKNYYSVAKKATFLFISVSVLALSNLSAQQITVAGVTASDAQAGFPATNTLDIDLTSRWSAQNPEMGPSQTITYDLGGSYDVSMLKLAAFKGNERTTSFEVEISTDGTTFTPVLVNNSTEVRVVTGGTTLELEDYAFTGGAAAPDFTANYVRIVGYGNSSNRWNSYTEVEIFGEQNILSVKENVAFEATVFSVPNSGVLNVANIAEQFNKVSLYSLDGKKVLDYALDSFSTTQAIDVSSLTIGLYILSLESVNGKIASTKVAIQ